jgi:hypothetical protein
LSPAAARARAPKAAAGKPMPGEISAAECAKRLGITAQSLGMWAKRPGAPARVDGKRVWVQWPSIARWREEELCRQRVEEATKALRAQLDARQDGDPMMRKLEGEARKIEIEVEMLERSRIKVEDADAVVAKMLTDLRSAVLPFPRVAAPKLLGAKTVQELEQRMQVLVVRLLEHLSAPSFGEEDTRESEQAA